MTNDNRPQLVNFPRTNLADVPLQLRRLADRIESGEEPASDHAIVVLEHASGGLSVFGFGKAGDLAREVGLLHMATLQLAVVNDQQP